MCEYCDEELFEQEYQYGPLKGPEYIPSYDEPSVKGWLNLWDIDGERRWAVVGTSPRPAPASVEVFYCPWCGRELD